MDQGSSLNGLPYALIAIASWIGGFYPASSEPRCPVVTCGSCNCGGVASTDLAGAQRQRLDSVSWIGWLISAAILAGILWLAHRYLEAFFVDGKQSPARVPVASQPAGVDSLVATRSRGPSTPLARRLGNGSS